MEHNLLTSQILSSITTYHESSTTTIFSTEIDHSLAPRLTYLSPENCWLWVALSNAWHGNGLALVPLINRSWSCYEIRRICN